MNKFTYRKLEWDTNYFGCDSSRIDIHQELDEKDVEQIKECIKLDRFITITNPKGFVNNNKIITHSLGAYLVDLNVQLINKQLTVSNDEPDEHVTIESNLDYSNDVLELVKDAFPISRFSNDEMISDDLSNGVYTKWVKSSFSKSNKYFCLHKTGIQIDGFILFSITNQNHILIELVTVEAQNRSSGIGTMLFNKLHHFAKNNNISISKVGTQIENIKAINFYNKNNYKIEDCSYTYHLWKDSIENEGEVL